jgi:TPR repeat protein
MPVAQASLGDFYANGRGGLARNDDEALRLFKLAAEQGDPLGNNNLGSFMSQGVGAWRRTTTRLHASEAARLYGLAAEQVVAFAQNKLAMFYEEGLGGLPRNTGEAARLYKLAAEQDRNLEAKRRAGDALTRLGAATAAVS